MSRKFERRFEHKSKPTTVITVGLCLESGETVPGDFLPTATLFNVIASCLSPESSSLNDIELVCIYKDKTVKGAALTTTTLESLGIIEGTAMISLLYREKLSTTGTIPQHRESDVPHSSKRRFSSSEVSERIAKHARLEVADHKETKKEVGNESVPKQMSYRWTECYKCHKMGHFARDCPTSDRHGGGNQGGRGGGAGYREGREDSRSSPRASCYNCGRAGHFARDCHESDKTCYSCGKSGHISRNCDHDERTITTTIKELRDPGQEVESMPSTSEPSQVQQGSEIPKAVIIDGCNVAREHGNYTFSSRGIEISVQHFINKGVKKVLAVVPESRRKNLDMEPPTTNPEILDKLWKAGYLEYSPSVKIGNQYVVPYDDRYILCTLCD